MSHNQGLCDRLPGATTLLASAPPEQQQQQQHGSGASAAAAAAAMAARRDAKQSFHENPGTYGDYIESAFKTPAQ
jgi:hypothetical protein